MNASSLSLGAGASVENKAGLICANKTRRDFNRQIVTHAAVTGVR
jgi:hypothetical protein